MNIDACTIHCIFVKFLMPIPTPPALIQIVVGATCIEDKL